MAPIMNTFSIVFLSLTMPSSSGRYQRRWQKAGKHTVGSPTQVPAVGFHPPPWTCTCKPWPGLWVAAGQGWRQWEPKAVCTPSIFPGSAPGDIWPAVQPTCGQRTCIWSLVYIGFHSPIEASNRRDAATQGKGQYCRGACQGQCSFDAIWLF